MSKCQNRNSRPQLATKAWDGADFRPILKLTTKSILCQHYHPIKAIFRQLALLGSCLDINDDLPSIIIKHAKNRINAWNGADFWPILKLTKEHPMSALPSNKNYISSISSVRIMPGY